MSTLSVTNIEGVGSLELQDVTTTGNVAGNNVTVTNGITSNTLAVTNGITANTYTGTLATLTNSLVLDNSTDDSPQVSFAAAGYDTYNLDNLQGTLRAYSNGVVRASLTANGTLSVSENLNVGQAISANSSYGTAGQVLTSGGSGANASWTTLSTGGTTLLGTINSSGSSVSLSGLDLSNYKILHIFSTHIIVGGNEYVLIGQSTADDVIVNSAVFLNTQQYYGSIFIDLSDGRLISNFSGFSPYGTTTPLRTTSTSISFSAGIRSFSSISIKVYGLS